jgi:hypothetical protein
MGDGFAVGGRASFGGGGPGGWWLVVKFLGCYTYTLKRVVVVSI